MECSLCGNIVLWCGKFANLTHTECTVCGAINSQTIEYDDFSYSTNNDDEGLEE